MNDWYPLLVSGPFDVTVNGLTLHARPTGSDIPIAFHVQATNEPPTIRIRFQYASGMDEPIRPVTVGTTSVRIGADSLRIFEFELRGIRNGEAEDLLRALEQVMSHLTAKTRLAGPLVNYEATRRGLSLGGLGPRNTPTWMVEALDRLRGTDSSRARER